MKGIILSIALLFITALNAQNFSKAEIVDSVKDYDGNLYHGIKLGNQVWLKEHIRSLHYSDGTSVQGVKVYNNDENNAVKLGRLYTWDAAMKNIKTPGTQGIAPAGYHIPTDAEWKELENFLGGIAVAGGKMKEAGTANWKAPNAGAGNGCGLDLLPAGEYDAHYSPNKYQLLNEYAVYWTSTEISTTKARERFLVFDKAESGIYDWYKTMYYSILCVKDTPAVDNETEDNSPGRFELRQNYPNPFNPSTTINFTIPNSAEVSLVIYDCLGREVKTINMGYKKQGEYEYKLDASDFPSGVYLYRLTAGKDSFTRKMIVCK